MIVLNTPAVEQGVYWITTNFLDEDNNAMAPDTATWTLSDMQGNVINAQQDIEIEYPGHRRNRRAQWRRPGSGRQRYCPTDFDDRGHVHIACLWSRQAF